jgi:hypothetical protein
MFTEIEQTMENTILPTPSLPQPVTVETTLSTETQDQQMPQPPQDGAVAPSLVLSKADELRDHQLPPLPKLTWSDGAQSNTNTVISERSPEITTTTATEQQVTTTALSTAPPQRSNPIPIPVQINGEPTPSNHDQPTHSSLSSSNPSSNQATDFYFLSPSSSSPVKLQKFPIYISDHNGNPYASEINTPIDSTCHTPLFESDVEDISETSTSANSSAKSSTSTQYPKERDSQSQTHQQQQQQQNTNLMANSLPFPQPIKKHSQLSAILETELSRTSFLSLHDSLKSAASVSATASGLGAGIVETEHGSMKNKGKENAASSDKSEGSGVKTSGLTVAFGPNLANNHHSNDLELEPPNPLTAALALSLITKTSQQSHNEKEDLQDKTTWDAQGSLDRNVHSLNRERRRSFGGITAHSHQGTSGNVLGASGGWKIVKPDARLYEAIKAGGGSAARDLLARFEVGEDAGRKREPSSSSSNNSKKSGGGKKGSSRSGRRGSGGESTKPNLADVSEKWGYSLNALEKRLDELATNEEERNNLDLRREEIYSSKDEISSDANGRPSSDEEEASSRFAMGGEFRINSRPKGQKKLKKKKGHQRESTLSAALMKSTDKLLAASSTISSASNANLGVSGVSNASAVGNVGGSNTVEPPKGRRKSKIYVVEAPVPGPPEDAPASSGGPSLLVNDTLAQTGRKKSRVFIVEEVLKPESASEEKSSNDVTDTESKSATPEAISEVEITNENISETLPKPVPIAGERRRSSFITVKEATTVDDLPGGPKTEPRDITDLLKQAVDDENHHGDNDTTPSSANTSEESLEQKQYFSGGRWGFGGSSVMSKRPKSAPARGGGRARDSSEEPTEQLSVSPRKRESFMQRLFHHQDSQSKIIDDEDEGSHSGSHHGGNHHNNHHHQTHRQDSFFTKLFHLHHHQDHHKSTSTTGSSGHHESEDESRSEHNLTGSSRPTSQIYDSPPIEHNDDESHTQTERHFSPFHFKFNSNSHKNTGGHAESPAGTGGGEHGLFKDLLTSRRSRADSLSSGSPAKSSTKHDPSVVEKYGKIEEFLGKGANATVRLVSSFLVI